MAEPTAAFYIGEVGRAYAAPLLTEVGEYLLRSIISDGVRIYFVDVMMPGGEEVRSVKVLSAPPEYGFFPGSRHDKDVVSLLNLYRDCGESIAPGHDRVRIRTAYSPSWIILYNDIEFRGKAKSPYGHGLRYQTVDGAELWLGRWNHHTTFVKVPVDCGRRFTREFLLATRLKHPNITRYFGGAINGKTKFLLSERHGYGNVKEFCKNHRAEITDFKELTAALSLAKAIVFLGQSKIVHRFVDCRVVSVLNRGMELSLGAFEFAIYVGDESSGPGGKRASKRTAPEAMTALPLWSNKSDIFSVGIIIWELITGFKVDLYPDQGTAAAVCERVEKGRIVAVPDNEQGHCLASLCTSLLEYNRDARTSASQMEAKVERLRSLTHS